MTTMGKKITNMLPRYGIVESAKKILELLQDTVIGKRVVIHYHLIEKFVHPDAKVIGISISKPYEDGIFNVRFEDDSIYSLHDDTEIYVIV